MQVLYFGWVRSKIGIGRETLEPPADITDVRGLVEWLRAENPRYEEAFKDIKALRFAVNQELTTLDTPITAGDEVAVFPPMTGG